MSRYLSVQEVIQINIEVILRFGGVHGIRDSRALDAAVARPQTGYYKDVIEEAAALFESLSQNHPFLDGNKRTAVTSMGVFLKLNGHELSFDDFATYSWLISLYESQQLTKATIERWLRQHSREM